MLGAMETLGSWGSGKGKGSFGASSLSAILALLALAAPTAALVLLANSVGKLRLPTPPGGTLQTCRRLSRGARRSRHQVPRSQCNEPWPPGRQRGRLAPAPRIIFSQL